MRKSGIAGLLVAFSIPGLIAQTRYLFLWPGKTPRATMLREATPLDCSRLGTIAFHVRNGNDAAIPLSLEVKDTGGAVTKATIKIRARADEGVASPLNSPDPLDMGMRGPAAIPGYHLFSSDYHKIDASHVYSIVLRLPAPDLAGKLTIDDVRLVTSNTYDCIVDVFGQFAADKWPGKLENQSQFAERRAAEEAAIASSPRLPGRDEYGGWATGPKLDATGFFRAAKHGGKWWLVTPGGHLFLSFGVNSLNTSEGDTITEGREHMFQGLPAKAEPLAAHYRENRDWGALGLKIKLNMGQSFNFYCANLQRKYGDSWYESWKEATLARLPAWGFNTIGNWSDPQLYGRKMPYTVTIDPWPADSGEKKPQFAEVASGNDYWKRMADPFDPRYAQALDRGTRAQALAHRDDPWCLGYFIDNEMSWGSMKDERSRYGLALGALAMRADSPAKRAFAKNLQTKYGDIAKLNQAWGTKLASWQALLDNPVKPAGELGAATKEDLRAFSKDFARQYFRVVIGILKKYDANHLYLGPRFAWHTRESVEACGELCDVISFNIYRPKVAPSEWGVLDGIDKPVLIGEFHMGALDRGMFHTGLVPAEDQADRARMYQGYIRSVVDNPLFVGCHYFKYADEPLTGRPGDGENYNIGLVSVTDTPYAEFLAAAKAVHAEAYQRRAGAAPTPAAQRLGRFAIDEEQGNFLVDGKPFQIVSGEMHYLRIPPEYWRERLLMARAMGLNTIATYVFWNMHEPKPGAFNFSGAADLARFVKIAQEVGLYVIIRPGPYACAEWEFGGYPAWLLKDHSLQVRSMDERYLKASERYLQRLGHEIAPLQNTRGGPIIMVQFENEYGSYGKDKAYLHRVREMLKQAGFNVPLFTSDGPEQMPNGYLPEALPAINGSVDQEIFDTIRKFRPKGPFFVAEFYPGWLDHWGEPHAQVDAAKSAGELQWMLSHGVSVNLYMFHGGTSFGFMNGANYSDHYQPQPTSYDYDAPLDEAGRPTPKYYKFRQVIGKSLPVPQARATIAIPRFELKQSVSLVDALPVPVKSERPLSMEDVGQSYGYILYRTHIDKPVTGPLTITELSDFAVVLLNGRMIASLDRRRKQDTVELKVSETPAVLDILVENGGRINYGPLLTRNRKGITEKVTLAGKDLTGWEIYPLPMEAEPAIPSGKQASGSGPVLRKGTFQVDDPGDTFLDMRGWGKGCVFVNGHNLGRFWRIGPQQTLYLPGVWLRKGANEIVVLDLENRPQRSIAGLPDPILNHLTPE